MCWLLPNSIVSAVGSQNVGSPARRPGGPSLGEDLLQVLQFALANSSAQPLPSGRASSIDVHPASDSDPSRSCNYLLHTFLLFMTLLPCWIYKTPNKQHFMKLRLGPVPLSHFTLLSHVQEYNYHGVKGY